MNYGNKISYLISVTPYLAYCDSETHKNIKIQKLKDKFKTTAHFKLSQFYSIKLNGQVNHNFSIFFRENNPIFRTGILRLKEVFDISLLSEQLIFKRKTSCFESKNSHLLQLHLHNLWASLHTSINKRDPVDDPDEKILLTSRGASVH